MTSVVQRVKPDWFFTDSPPCVLGCKETLSQPLNIIIHTVRHSIYNQSQRHCTGWISRGYFYCIFNLFQFHTPHFPFISYERTLYYPCAVLGLFKRRGTLSVCKKATFRNQEKIHLKCFTSVNNSCLFLVNLQEIQSYIQTTELGVLTVFY